MSTARRLYLILVTALCMSILFAQTAHQAQSAARIVAGSVLSSEPTVKLASTAPQPRFAISSILALAGTDKSPVAVAWMFALSVVALALANAAVSRRFLTAWRELNGVQPQRPVFSLRI